jgi:phospholipid/cholesterol/gamma-HCH transport system substrate-binding protein
VTSPADHPPPAAGEPRAAAATPPVEQVERRAGLLLIGLLVLVLGSAAYLLYARGAFEPTQRLVLVADNSEGVTVGMDLTFSGFPIGRVRRIELTPQGQARIVVDVPRADAHWLRQSSVFTLTRGLLGTTSLRAYSGLLDDPPLPPGAQRRLLEGDASAELPRLLGQVRELAANLSALTAEDSALAGTLAHARSIAGKIDGAGGALGVLTGSPDDARRVGEALRRTNALLARLEALASRTDGLVGRADAVVGQAGEQLFGPQGLAQDAQAGLRQLQALLADARGTLQRADALLQEAQGTARNLRVATTDLDVMRAEVEASLRRIDGLVAEIDRKWPFRRDTELRLP